MTGGAGRGAKGGGCGVELAAPALAVGYGPQGRRTVGAGGGGVLAAVETWSPCMGCAAHPSPLPTPGRRRLVWPCPCGTCSGAGGLRRNAERRLRLRSPPGRPRWPVVDSDTVGR